MLQICTYDKSRDLHEVRPGLACDIAQAKETGAIIDNSVVDEYNNISDCELISGLLDDTFKQIDYMRTMAKKSGNIPAGLESKINGLTPGVEAPSGEPDQGAQ